MDHGPATARVPTTAQVRLHREEEDDWVTVATLQSHTKWAATHPCTASTARGVLLLLLFPRVNKIQFEGIFNLVIKRNKR